MAILPADPRAIYLVRQDEILAAVRRVLDDGHYILGQECASFEAEFAAYLGAGYCVGVASGTDALQLGLRALGVAPGDGVITVSHTAVATVAAIELAGAVPVLVDVDEDDFCMSPEGLAAAIDRYSGTLPLRAVLPVHLYGQPAKMAEIRRICDQHGLLILEDCAQAHGAGVGQARAGTLGHAAAFSFYPTKNLGAFGDGGAFVTSDAATAERARRLREYGWAQRYVSEEPGLNSRLDELQAAILRVKLPHLDAENERRRQIAAAYSSQLIDTSFVLPRETPGTHHVYHQYVIRSRLRDELRSFLAGEGIGTLIHYPVPCHLQPAYKGRVALSPAGLAVTEALCDEILSLPMHAGLTDSDVESICSALIQFDRR